MSKVLIVDDAYSMRNLIKKTLKEAGHEVVGEAKNGLEGIELFEQFQPDIVTMDIKMPDISGIETTKRIMEKFPHAVILAVTGNNVEEIKQEMLSAGAVDYLRKPFQPAFLLQKIDTALVTRNNQVEEESAQNEQLEQVLDAQPAPHEQVVIETTLSDEISDDELLIELSNESDSLKVTPLIIENEEDVFEFPNDYPLEEEIEKHAIQVDSESEVELVFEEEPIELASPTHTHEEPTSNPPASPSIEATNLSLSFDDTENVRKYAQIKPQPFDSPIRIRPPKTNYGRPSQFDHDDDDVSDEDFILDTSDEDQSENLKGNRLFGFVKKLFKP